MSGRIIYYYERTLTSQVGDIEHIESQSLAGYGVVKISPEECQHFRRARTGDGEFADGVEISAGDHAALRAEL